jgi:hypothetical protein
MASGTKRRQAELDAAQRERDSAVTALKEPDPGEAYVKGKNLEFLKAFNGDGGGPVDATTLPGMGVYLDLFNKSKSGRAVRDNMGSATMGQQYSSPEMKAVLASQMQGQREEEAGGALEDAVAGKYAEASGSVLPFAQLAFQRNATRMGASGDRFNQASAAANQPPWWMPLAMAGIGGASSAAGAYMGRPPH